MIAKHKLQARLINHIVLRASSLWLCGRRGFADGGGERRLGGACTPDATNFQPSPQIELGGSLTSGSLTWQQRCNHNSNTIDPITTLQVQHQPKSLCYSKNQQHRWSSSSTPLTTQRHQHQPKATDDVHSSSRASAPSRTTDSPLLWHVTSILFSTGSVHVPAALPTVLSGLSTARLQSGTLRQRLFWPAASSPCEFGQLSWFKLRCTMRVVIFAPS
jgi:hypothetical protein